MAPSAETHSRIAPWQRITDRFLRTTSAPLTLSLTRRAVVVVPCYNEAERLRPETFLAAVQEHPALQFLFVDDGSRDGTARVLDTLVARKPESLSCLKLSTNRGKAEAVRLGIREALKRSPELVGFLDADLSTPISELPLMAEAFADPEILVVLGSRVALLGREIRRSNRRHYLGRVFATLASMTLGLRVYDTQCGAKLFRVTDSIRRIFDREFLSSWAFDVELLARLRQMERAQRIQPVARTVVEVPLRQWTDIRGSKIGLGDSFIATLQLLHIWWRYRAD
jgi:dolichyl-phosphate beta-glucosyltransferase